MKKRIVALFLAVMMIFSLLPVSAFAEEPAEIVASGYCGGDTTAEYDEASGTYKNLSWKLDEEGTLTISGVGEMGYHCPRYSYKDSVASVVIGDGVTSINEYAFEQFDALTSVSIPDSVIRIGHYAFHECVSLKSVVIPDSVTKIERSVFYGCSSLESIRLSNSVKYLHDGTFSMCSSLKDLVIPDSVVFIEQNPFKGCSGLADENGFLIIRGVLYHYCGEGGDVVIPDGVTRIGDHAFYGCSNVTSVEIPTSVTEIGSNSFFGCTSLESIYIPDSVRKIGNAFYGCSSLKNIRLPENVILDAPFENCPELTDEDGFVIINNVLAGYYGEGGDIIVPDGVTRIADWAFSDSIESRVKITGVFLPDSIRSIGAEAFYDCRNLTSINIPDSVESIGEGAFRECSGLADENGFVIVNNILFGYFGEEVNVVLPSNVKHISFNALVDLNIESLTLNEGLETIADDAIIWDIGLTTVNIPKSVRSIGVGNFCAFIPLESIHVDPENSFYKDIDGVLFDKSGKTLIVYPAGKTDESYVVPDGVEKISIAAFAYSGAAMFAGFVDGGLTNITIPHSMKEIEAAAFYYCDKITDVYFKGTESEWAKVTVGDTYQPDKTFVPEDDTNATFINARYHFAPAPEIITSGNCGGDGDGSNMTWEVTPDGTLVIGGSGSMADYNDATDTPWKDYIDKITEVVINADVTDIDLSAFDGMENLENISISGKNRVFSSINGVVYNKNANELLYCPRGKTGEYEVHGGLKVIKANAFANCTKLTAIVIANSITTVEDNAFKGCKSLKVAAFTDSEPKNVGKAIFDNCAPDFTVSAVNSNGKWLKSARYDAKTHTWNGYPIVFGERTIVDSDNSGDTRWDVDKYGNLIIGSDGEMSGGTDLSGISADIKTAVIGEGTTSIAEDLFAGCENLEAVIIPDSVTEIGSGAFADCESLAAVEISSNVDNIGAGAFEGCRGLTEINVSDDNPNYCSVDGKLYNKNMTELIWVPEGAADDSITVPASVKTIGDGAFSGCEALEEVTLFEGLTEIGDGAFAGCENLSTVNVQRLAPKLMVKALFAANSIAADEVTKLPESVVRIGSEAFAGCSGISAMNISRTVREIGSRAFANCENLLAINVDENNTVYCSVDGVLYSKDMSVLICMPAGLTGVYEIPESVISIADGAFCGCTENLKVKADEKFVSCDFGGCIVCFGEDGYSYVNVVTPASCTEEGYTQLVRNDGVKGEKTNFTPAAGHKFGAWTVITAADCSNDGIATRTCAVCGESETRTIPHGHEFTYIVNAASCTSEELTVYTCSVCGYSYEEITGEKLDHALAHHDGKAATCTEAGWEAYDTCENCDYTTYKDIPAKGHSYGQPTFVWDGFKCSAYVACSCGDTQSVKCTVTSEVTSEATTKSEGVRTYTAAVTVDGQTYTSTKTESIPKLPDSGTNIIVEIITTIVNAITGIFKTIASWFR